MTTTLDSDLVTIFKDFESDIDRFRNRNILLTGATGMFGIWMLLFFKFLNENLGTKLIVEAVSRDPKLFLKENPEFITCDWIIWNKSDIRSFTPVLDRIDFIIHGATTSANETFQGTPPLEKFSVTFEGTLQVLKTIDKFQPEKFLFISSGSVYNSKTLERIKESETESPATSNTGAAIAHGKRAAEFACFSALEEVPGLTFNVARCFTFVGPYLPLDLHYAIGNFVRSVIKGEPIHLRNLSDVFRSYMYMSDSITWLLKILISDQTGNIYNVGSSESISLKELANLISINFGRALILGGLDQNLRADTSAPSFYVPDTNKIIRDLGVTMRIPLLDGIRKTIDFESARMI